MKIKPTSKKSKLNFENILVTVLVSGLVFAFSYGFLFADAANAQLIAIYEVAEVGDSLTELKEKVAEMPQSWITASYSQDDLIFSAPFKVGATEWMLRIHAENNQITCVKIHTMDSINIHPKTAPPDKGKCHYRWKDRKWVD